MTRLLLDAHLSGRAIGRALQDRGHDIRSLDAEKNLEGLRDEDVLELAISEDRVLITANVADFLPLLIESGRSHAGCILIPNSFRNEDFGPLISAIDRELQEVPPDEWTDRVSWARRSSARTRDSYGWRPTPKRLPKALRSYTICTPTRPNFRLFQDVAGARIRLM